MLYGTETWCLRENEIAILRMTERAMVRAMRGTKLMEKKRTEDLMEMLGFKETVVQMAKANGVRWYILDTQSLVVYLTEITPKSAIAACPTCLA